MKKLIMKRTTMFLMMVFIIFFISSLPNTNEMTTAGYDYSKSSSWGGNLNVTPLNPITYQSKYVAFSIISNAPELINTSNVYVINTANDLYNLSVACKGTNKVTYLGLDYVLGNDIDYEDAYKLGNLIYPIGYEELYPFTGTFDGQGFSISNLFLKPIESLTDYQNNFNNNLKFYSLFSRVAASAVVKHVGIINPIMVQPINWENMNYASPLVGLNLGLVENVYMIDNRTDAGISVDGDFYLSGLVSVNQGTFRNSFVAAETIKSTAVATYLGVKPVLYENMTGGNTSNLYYDDTLYFDQVEIDNYNTALLTSQFQDSANFGEEWYFNSSYPVNAMVDNVYPSLKGMNMDINGYLEITSAMDLWYFTQLLSISQYFREATYTLVDDIDMNQISIGLYKTPKTNFGGRLTSNTYNLVNGLYSHASGEGANGYSILNYTSTEPTTIGNFKSYGFLGNLSGIIENINFVNIKIIPSSLSSNIQMTSYIGLISGNLDRGTIRNVHVLGDITLPNQEMGKTYVGGMIGYGRGLIESSTTNGTITGGVHLYNTYANGSAIGGLIGYSSEITIKKSINQMNITGISFNATNASTLYLAGIMGYGITNQFSEVINKGNITSHDITGNINIIHLGGIVGLQTQVYNEVYRANNEGNITLVVKASSLIAKLSGYGNVKGTNNSGPVYNFFSLSNKGLISTFVPSGTTFPSTNNYELLDTINIEVAGVAITDGVNGNFNGVFNSSNLNIDLSLIYKLAGNLLANNMYTTEGTYNNTSSNYGTKVQIFQSYNTGNISVTTSLPVTSTQVKISGNTLGKNITYNQLRNSGDISINITQPTTKLLNSATASDGLTTPYKRFKVLGLLEEVSTNQTAENLYNGGNITVQMTTGLKFKFNMFISGIAYKNDNKAIYPQGYDLTSIIIDPSLKGSIHNAINDGQIDIRGEFYGAIRVSGIVSINTSMISSAFNTGNLYNENATKLINAYSDNDTFAGSTTVYDQFSVETGGITFLMMGPYAQIKDCANYGFVAAKATTENGWVHAGGIVVRNEKDENELATSTPNAYLAKIEFSINYGNVFVWNPKADGTKDDYESRCKSAGILTLGIASVVNSINYGNVYSRYVASGIYGFFFFQNFNLETATGKLIYIANSINYGKIRRLISTFTYNDLINFDNSNNNYTFIDYFTTTYSKGNGYAFGAVIGKIHTGDPSGWQFNGGHFSIDAVAFSYLINFDAKIDIIGLSPKSASEAIDSTNINLYMANIKLNDSSIYPFANIKAYSLDEAPLTGQTGIDNSTYYMGIFNQSFSLRTPPSAYGVITDMYISDFIQYLPYEKINTTLATKVGASFGIYALSSATGINNGEFLPDNIDINILNPRSYVYKDDELTPEVDPRWVLEEDNTWKTTIESGGYSIDYKFNQGMKQLKKSIASSIFDMELISNDGLTKLKNPEINLNKKTITYYVPNNSDGATGTTLSKQVNKGYQTPNMDNNSRYIFDSPTLSTGKYVGSYVNNSGTYSLTGPYASTGVYDITFTSKPILATSGYRRYTKIDPYGETVYIYSYVTGLSQKDELYLNPTPTSFSAGYGAYSYNGINYVYVGPNTTTTYQKLEFNVYTASIKTYQVNTDSTTYDLARNATIKVDDTNNVVATLPLSTGIYTTRTDTDESLIDTMNTHFGKVRVYSEAYDPIYPNDTYTYTDYTIRVVRLDDQSFSAMNNLTVDGVDSKPATIPDLKNVTATTTLYYKNEGNNGVIMFSYNTINLLNGINLLENLTLKKGTEVISSTLYSLKDGIVKAGEGYHPALGMQSGSVSFEFIINQDLPSGNYTIELYLSESMIYQIYFIKEQSSEANVIYFEHNGMYIEPTSNTYDTYIPYGIYHNTTDDSTDIVDFTNFNLLTNINYDVLANNLPSYLDSMKISPYSKLEKVELRVSLNGYIHTYMITYYLLPEDTTKPATTFTHRLIETSVPTDVSLAYYNGSIVQTTPLNQFSFEREETPTYRFDYEFSNAYFLTGSELNIYNLTYVGSGLTPVINNQYFTNINKGFGFEIYFDESSPVGQYTFDIEYYNSKTIVPYAITGGEELVTWDMPFQSVILTKKPNINSHLSNITFVSDTVYSGFNTIIDINLITESTYTTYLLTPSSRLMYVYPSSGINYNNYVTNQLYYVVGQVQKTNLSYYEPSFYLPIGATIKRIVNIDQAGDPSVQSDIYASDFNPNIDNTFNFIWYRVYAEDYNMSTSPNNNYYTDYYIAVQDVTNNVRFNITINSEAVLPFNRTYVTFDTYSDTGLESSMSLYSNYSSNDQLWHHFKFAASTSGLYKVYLDLPEGYSFTITAPSLTVNGKDFTVPSSIVPRQYSITITIIVDSSTIPDWGQHDSSNHNP